MTSNHGRHDVDVLKRELVGLFEHIQRIRREIAAIRRPGASGGEDHFVQMSDELDAIVAATEQATDSIMGNVEQMEDLIGEVRTMVTDPAVLSILDTFPEKTGAIFEACAFQDITGQRITKVVNSLQFVETRVNALIDMWGASELTKVEANEKKETDEYKKYLNGPQLAGQGVSQADVDAMLFGGAPSAAPKPATAAPAPVVAPAPAPKPAPAPAPKPAAAAPAPAPRPVAAPAAAPRPAPAPAAQAPKPPPAPRPAPPPPPKPTEPPAEGGPALGQDDIDKLFG